MPDWSTLHSFMVCRKPAPLSRLFLIVWVTSACSPAVAAHADLPPEPAASTAPIHRRGTVWIYRHLFTGAVSRGSALTLRTLTLDGDHAMLTVATKTAPNGEMFAESIRGPWVDASLVTFVGTAQVGKGTLELALRHGSDALALSCTRNAVNVAAETAVRVRSGDDSECGDVGTWAPAATTPLYAWVCHEKTASPNDASPEELTFGEAPGIEFLFINDDCVIQGGGLRRVPRDGSIANVRGKQPEAPP